LFSRVELRERKGKKRAGGVTEGDCSKKKLPNLEQLKEKAGPECGRTGGVVDSMWEGVDVTAVNRFGGNARFLHRE